MRAGQPATEEMCSFAPTVPQSSYAVPKERKKRKVRDPTCGLGRASKKAAWDAFNNIKTSVALKVRAMSRMAKRKRRNGLQPGDPRSTRSLPNTLFTQTFMK